MQRFFSCNCSTPRRRRMARGSWLRLTLYAVTLAFTRMPITILNLSTYLPALSTLAKMGKPPMSFFFLFFLLRLIQLSQGFYPTKFILQLFFFFVSDSYRLPNFKHLKVSSVYQTLYTKQLFNSLILMEMEWLHLVRSFFFAKKLAFKIGAYLLYFTVYFVVQTSSLRWCGKLCCIRKCPLIWIAVLSSSTLERTSRGWSVMQSSVSFYTWVSRSTTLASSLRTLFFLSRKQAIYDVTSDNDYEIRI